MQETEKITQEMKTKNRFLKLITRFLAPVSRVIDRTEATDIVAEVKVKVVNEDFIRVVVDRSAGENAAQVAHGWPQACGMP
ncbi:MAG: hypothetical protein LBL07_09570 [Tannerella sp.]|jgi:ribosomal protein S28E/S33|nr:hypothetical protein [Tannerella sp.]